MKNLLLGAVLLFSLSSCDKEETNQIENKKYPVQFNTTGFTSEISPLKSGITESEDRFYAVFDSEQKFVKEIRFAADDQIKDVLSAGEYTAFIGVSNDNSSFLIYSDDPVIKYSNFQFNNFFAEVYLGKVKFTVGENDNNNIPIVLNRMNGKLEIVLEDEIPSQSTVTVQLSTIGYALKLDNFNTHNSSNESFTYTNETASALSPIITTNLVPSHKNEIDVQNLSTITLTCRDKNDNILGIKTIENVRLERNTLTTLTGKLLSNDPNSTDSGFALTFNEDWNPAIEKTF